MEVFVKMLFSMALAVGLLATASGQTWENWLVEKLGYVGSERGDEIVAMLSALEQEHRVVKQKHDLFDGANDDISSVRSLTAFARKVGRNVDSSFVDISAEYRQMEYLCRLEGSIHYGTLSIVLHDSLKARPAEARARIAGLLAGLSVNRNMIGRDKSREWHRQLNDLQAVCQGMGGLLLDSVRAECPPDGSPKSGWRFSSGFALKPAEVAWAMGVLSVLRAEKDVVALTSPLGEIVLKWGMEAAQANQERIRQVFGAHIKALDEGTAVELPIDLPIWEQTSAMGLPDDLRDRIDLAVTDKQLPAKVSASAGNEVKAVRKEPVAGKSATKGNYTEAQFALRRKMKPLQGLPDQASLSNALKRVGAVIAKKKKASRESKLMAMQEFLSDDDPAVRYCALREKVRLLSLTRAWREIESVFRTVYEKEGAEFAMNILLTQGQSFRSQMKNLPSLSSNVKTIQTALAFFKEYEKALLEGRAERDVHRQAARAYLELGCVQNARVEFALADAKAEELLRMADDGKPGLKTSHKWLPPQPETEIADFWWMQGLLSEELGRRCCFDEAREWYQRALSRVSGYHKPDWDVPLWVRRARFRSARVVGKDGSVSCGVQNRAAITLLLGSSSTVTFGDLRLPLPGSAQAYSLSQAGPRPHAQWLYRNGSIFMGDGRRLCILASHMKNRPWRDDGNRQQDVPFDVTTASDAALKRWVADYHCASAEDVSLTKVDFDGVSGVIVHVKDDTSIGVVLRLAGMIFLDFQVDPTYTLSQNEIRRFVKLITFSAKGKTKR